MTKEFRYKGFTSPNGTIVPDDVFDVLAPELTEAELRVLLYIVRRTFGFKKNADAISLGQLCNGIKTRDGRILDRGTGMSRSAVIRGAQGLVDKGVLVKRTSRTEDGENETNVYSMHFTDDGSAQETDEINAENRGVVLQNDYRSLPKNPPQFSKATTVVLQEDPQQTALQQTDINHSNIRKSTNSKDDFVDNSISQPISLVAQNGNHADTSARVFRGMEGVGEVLKRKRGRPRKFSDETSQTILNYVTDFSREFADKATVNQSAARFINDFQKWGKGDMDAFIGILYQARSITKSQGGIRGSKFAYFASVVEDLLGLRDEHGTTAAAQ